MSTDWAKLDRQRHLDRREARFDGSAKWPGENGKTEFFPHCPYKFKSRFESDDTGMFLMEKQIYETSLHPLYTQRVDARKFYESQLPLTTSRKAQAKYTDTRLIQDHNDMGETTSFLENKRREARLDKKSYKSLNLKEMSASELRLRQFRTLSSLAEEIELSYKPLVGKRAQKKTSYAQSQSMKRLLSGASSIRPAGEREHIQLS
jgi:hypothetical protein